MLNRKVRKVPKDWEHPKDKNGNYIPLFDGAKYKEAVDRWDIEAEKWEQGFYDRTSLDASGTWQIEWLPKESLEKDLRNLSFSEWNSDRPNEDDYTPTWEDNEADHFMMYEECTEGTPLSPAFASKEELAEWLALQNVSVFADSCCNDPAQWLDIINAPELAMPVFVKDSE